MTMNRRIAHIVDDDPEILASVSFMLSTEGIETSVHGCSEDFIAALPELPPGCIVLDIFMPGMSGLVLQRHLHQLGCRMPVVMITGHGDVSSAVAAMKEGATDFIQKPFAKAELLAALESAWAELQRPPRGRGGARRSGGKDRRADRARGRSARRVGARLAEQVHRL